MRARNKTENVMRHSAAQELVAKAFNGLVSLWPADSREWALAMQAELSEMESTQESLRWLAGGIMSLGKAWWNHVVYGWNEREKEPAPVKTPGPLAFALALVALVAFIALPSVHEGVSAVANSWRIYNNPRAAEFRRMAREAEANHDAKTLAFLSTRMNSLDENARLAKEAVAMDPSFTWIFTRGGSYWYAYNHPAERYGRIQQVEAVDPDNAVPYLTEAGIRENELRMDNNFQVSKEKILNDPHWRSAMEKAFAAPRYDSYYSQSIELQESMLKAHNLRQPQDVARGVYEYYSSGLFVSQMYVDYLLDQAKQAKQKDDTAQAIRLAWTVAQFAEHARANLHNEWAIGTVDRMTFSANEILVPLEAAAGQTEVANLLSLQNASINRRNAEKTPGRFLFVDRAYGGLESASIAIQAGGLGVIILGWALILSAIYLIAARFAPRMRAGRLYRWACNCGRFVPAALVAAVILTAAMFAPYFENVQNYFAGMHDSTTLHALLSTEQSLYQLPSMVVNPMLHNVYAAYSWLALLTIAIIAGTLFLTRKMFHTQGPSVKAV
jgi:hypothetical protein